MSSQAGRLNDAETTHPTEPKVPTPRPQIWSPKEVPGRHVPFFSESYGKPAGDQQKPMPLCHAVLKRSCGGGETGSSPMEGI